MAAGENEWQEMPSALASTLEAAAAILPWLQKAGEPRFPPELSKRWQAACERLALGWTERYQNGLASLRPAVFELYGTALELGDADCLRLAEALASATDRLEILAEAGHPPLVAALSATFESFAGSEGLEHKSFPERARHFAARLEHCADPHTAALPRAPIVDRLFVEEAGDCLERMHDALARLPADLYGIKTAAEEIVHLAEPLELDEVSALAGRLLRFLVPADGAQVDLDASAPRATLLARLSALEDAVAAIAPD